jgi:hypothetical protein
MVGGQKVARVIEEIRKLAQAPRPTALLLVGETGVDEMVSSLFLSRRRMRQDGSANQPSRRKRGRP